MNLSTLLTIHSDMKTQHLLVFEPMDIVWIGIQQTLSDVGIRENVILTRVRTYVELKETLHYYSPDVLLLPYIESGAMVISLLNNLYSQDVRFNDLVVIACVQHDIPYLSVLLRGFGVDWMFTPALIENKLISMMKGDWEPAVSMCQGRFTLQERCVILELLAGHNVSWIARTMGKNIRTISTQKGAALQKMKMFKTGDFQMLAGRLMTEAE